MSASPPRHLHFLKARPDDHPLVQSALFDVMAYDANKVIEQCACAPTVHLHSDRTDDHWAIGFIHSPDCPSARYNCLHPDASALGRTMLDAASETDW